MIMKETATFKSNAELSHAVVQVALIESLLNKLSYCVVELQKPRVKLDKDKYFIHDFKQHTLQD